MEWHSRVAPLSLQQDFPSKELSCQAHLLHGSQQPGTIKSHQTLFRYHAHVISYQFTY